jgi:alkylation response protein AidB-like acyl-CoA dehydrogenase
LALAAGGVGPGTFQLLRELAEEREKLGDGRIRQELARLHTELELMRMNSERTRQKNQQTGGEGNLAKLLMTSALHRTRELAGSILGPDMALWGDESVTGGMIQEMAVFSPAPSIYGGTDEVQRNIIGERVLGLPKEPGPDKGTSFAELLQNKTDW